jgi:hypothetical protein
MQHCDYSVYINVAAVVVNMRNFMDRARARVCVCVTACSYFNNSKLIVLIWFVYGSQLHSNLMCLFWKMSLQKQFQLKWNILCK